MSQVLTVEQLDFFRDNGYLILHNVLDPELMAQTRDAWWDAAPPELKRDDPETWVDAFSDSRYTFKYRDLSFDPWLIELLHGNPKLQAVAKQLLGPDLETPERIRGIYCVFPDTEETLRPAHFHVDAHAFHLGVVGYVDDVPPRRRRLHHLARQPQTFLSYVQDRLHVQPVGREKGILGHRRVALRSRNRPRAYIRLCR